MKKATVILAVPGLVLAGVPSLDYWGYTPTVDELVPGEVFTVDLEFLVTGGTGRFEEADGGGEMTAFVLFENLSAPVVAAGWVWGGTIGY